MPKGLLRRAAVDLLPRSLVDRAKSMYPATSDPRYDRSVRESGARLLTSGSPLQPLLDATRTRALIDGTSSRPPWLQRMALAYLTQVDAWMTAYRVELA